MILEFDFDGTSSLDDAKSVRNVKYFLEKVWLQKVSQLMLIQCSILGLVLPGLCYCMGIIGNESGSLVKFANLGEWWRELFCSFQTLIGALRQITSWSEVFGVQSLH